MHPCSDKNKDKILGIRSFTVSTAVERTRTAVMSNRKRSTNQRKEPFTGLVYKRNFKVKWT